MNRLEISIIGPHPRPTGSETLERGLAVLASGSGGSHASVRSENHWSDIFCHID